MEPVRVLQVIGAMNRAGTETVVMNLMRAINQQQVHFDFLVHTPKRCDYDDEIEALGGTIYHVPRYTVANGPAYRAACRRLFAAHPEIQVVHGHIGSSSALYLDEARKAGCATVAHSHSVRSNDASPKKRLRRVVYGSLVRKLPAIADEFLACSYQAGFDRFGPGVAGGAHFHVMNNGIHVTQYECGETAHRQARRALGFGEGPLVGNVARLIPEKNQSFLLEVFARTLHAYPNARLLLVGRGPAEGSLRAQAANLGIATAVEFLGVRDDVPEILKALDAFVFTSTREGLGMAVVEAQAAGVPTVTSDAVPQAAIVSPLAQRLPLAAGADEWARRLNGILANPVSRTPQAAAIRAHGYDIEDVAAWMTAFYTQLARHSARAAESRR